jgi:hypothetical protein
MTTKRLALGRAVAVAGLLAFTSFAPAARADVASAAPEATASTSAAPEAAASASAAPASAPAAPVVADEPAASTSNRTVWPWVIMGTGVALIATATVLQFHAVSEDDKRESDEVKLFALPQGDPQRKALQNSAADHDASASSSRTASLVVGTVGFLAVAGSVVLWFFEGSSSPSAAAPSRASGSGTSARLTPTFTPSLRPGYAGASLGASF